MTEWRSLGFAGEARAGSPVGILIVASAVIGGACRLLGPKELWQMSTSWNISKIILQPSDARHFPMRDRGGVDPAGAIDLLRLLLHELLMTWHSQNIE